MVARGVLAAAAAGLAGSAATAVVDRLTDPLIGRDVRRRERRLREGSPHDVMPRLIAERLTHGQPGPGAMLAGKVVFTLAFSLGWGLVHGLARRAPVARRLGGLPFAVPFFLLCDAAIAPAVGLNPPARRLPWQLNAKELLNHAAWTAAAEGVRRALADRR